MILEPLTAVDGALPGHLLTEVTALYAANREFFAISGDFPDPDGIGVEQVAKALADELARPGAEVLLARSEGRLVGVVITLAHHPDPTDPDPWIGLLIVAADPHRTGVGREVVRRVEDRFRAAGRGAVRLAVPENNPKALRFWTALGYLVIGHREDRAPHRPCAVLRKPL
ncbi:GNAT family N-acetyltransferase [Streptomyces huasconensis]|uniref:GNAT family N-acetyltransferase n=1 Tax=Streptomyces huasconensis TaxID=1854574 RepID=UPI0033D9B344